MSKAFAREREHRGRRRRSGESVDRDGAVRRPHGCDERRKARPGIRRHVAVVAGMQACRRPVHGQSKPGDPARTQREARQAARVDRAVAEDPEIGLEDVAMRREGLGKVRRAGLLLALEEELQVCRQRDLRGVQGIEGSEHSDDRTLVVARRARIDARLVRQRVLRIGPGNRRGAVLGTPRAQHGLEWRRLPRALRRRPAGRRNAHRKVASASPLSPCVRRRPQRARQAFRGYAPRRHASPAWRRARPRSADVGLVRRDVRQCQQLAQLRDDRGLMARDVPLRGGHRLRLVGRGRSRKAVPVPMSARSPLQCLHVSAPGPETRSLLRCGGTHARPGDPP